MPRRGGLKGSGLTDRQLDVLRKVSEGKTSRQVADELGVSHSTVRNTMSYIYQKLGVLGKVGAVVWYVFRRGKKD